MPDGQGHLESSRRKGAVYATGAGNATNLGLATLTSPPAAPAAAAPAVSGSPRGFSSYATSSWGGCVCTTSRRCAY